MRIRDVGTHSTLRDPAQSFLMSKNALMDFLLQLCSDDVEVSVRDEPLQLTLSALLSHF